MRWATTADEANLKENPKGVRWATVDVSGPLCGTRALRPERLAHDPNLGFSLLDRHHLHIVTQGLRAQAK